MRKKFLAVVLAAALACNMTGMTAAAQPAVAGLSVLRGLLGQDEGGEDTKTEEQAASSENSSKKSSSKKEADKVTLDIGQGDIIISKNGITAVDTAGNPVTETSSQYVITGSTQDHAIVVEDGVNANIVLSNVSIVRTMDGVSPLRIADNSTGTVRVQLEGNNTLQGGPGAAGIQKNCTHTDASCRCGTLEISCASTDGGHICDSTCGTLNATGSNGAAGIGGGTGMGSAKINIKGGMVTANGGVGGASGGLGTKVTVAGGMVNAGSLNGKSGSDANLMNGNTLVFADAAAELQAKRGILYQNGAGTVYGAVELSQGLADYLPADSTLTIPDGSKLTIDESVTLPNADKIDGEVTVKRAKTPTPTATPKETPVPQRAMAAAVEEETQNEAQARVMVGTTNVVLDILYNSGPLTGGYLSYGDTITLQATIIRNSQTVSVDSTGSGLGTVEFFGAGRSLGSVYVERDSGTVTVESREILLTSSEFPEVNGGLGGTLTGEGTQINFKAVYSGGENYQGSEGDTNLIVTQGKLSSAYTAKGDRWDDFEVVAGKTVGAGIRYTDPSFGFEATVKNQAGDEVQGTWQWVGADTPSKRMWPSGQRAEYQLQFELTNSRDKAKYSNDPYTITVAPTVRVPEVDSEGILSLTRKSGEWYNASSGTIEAIAESGYKLRTVAEAPTLPDDWSTTDGWLDHVAFPSDLDYYNGTYRGFYAWKEDGEELIRVLIQGLKIDKRYPKISEFNYRVTGTTGYLTFRVGNETVAENNDGTDNNGSGVKNITCRAEPRWLSGGTLNSYEPPSDPRESLGGRDATAGNVTLTNLSPNLDYDVYVTVEDQAGNKTRYLQRLVDKVTGEKLDVDQGTQYSPDTEDLYYGYEFTTSDPDIAGRVNLSVTDMNGNSKRDVAFKDIITATAVITNAGEPDPEYSWYRESADGRTTTHITDTEPINIYTVREEDIGCKIICRVEAKGTSAYLEAKTLEIQKGVCPAEDAPQYISENSLERTFTFSGNPEREYEYRIKGRSDNWEPVNAASGAATMVLQLDDITIPAGSLEVRAKESALYQPSEPITNLYDFVSTKELEVTINGNLWYGETLTADFESEVIMPNDVTYEWSYLDNGRPIPDAYGRFYQLQKEDVGKVIQVKIVSETYDVSKTADTGRRIGKRPVDAMIQVPTKEYDGTTVANATVSFTGILPGDELTGSVPVTFPDKNAGEYEQMTVGKFETDGADKAYYDVKSPEGDVKGVITPRQLAFDMTAEDKVYDGTTDATVRVIAGNVLDGDSVEVSGTGEFADKNAGTNKTVTSKDVVVTGADASNYTALGSTATATASITPKNISIEGITVADKVYDTKTDAVIAVTFAGAVDEVSYTYTAAFDTASVGMDKMVTATVTLSGDSAKNYVLDNGEATGTGNIVKALAPYEESDIPQNLTGVEGKKLSSVYIGSGFTWKEPNTVMEEVGRHTYDALYNPDPSQYSDRPVRIEVLVQCAKHTWGDWSTTVEPTKTELGERQRICSVCGYIEVETVPRAPYITNEDTKVGWGDIIQAINNASSGTEIPVTMNGTETLPATVQEVLQGRDVSLVLQMTDGITWTLRGQDITGSVLKDINLAVTLYTDNIPSDVLDPYLTGGKTAVQIHLAYSGEFGFTATLRIPLANEFAGVNSTFYYYNPNRERLEQMDTNRITSDGIGRYDLTHASDYVTIIDSQSSNGGGSASENTPTPGGNNNNNNNNNNTPGGSNGGSGGSAGTSGATGTASSNVTGTTSRNASLVSINAAKTADETPVAGYVMQLLFGAAGVVAIAAYRRSRRKESNR